MELGDDDASAEEVMDARQEWLTHPYTKDFLVKVNAARIDAERALVLEARSTDPNYTRITKLGGLSEGFQLVLDLAGVKKKTAIATEALKAEREKYAQLGKRK